MPRWLLGQVCPLPYGPLPVDRAMPLLCAGSRATYNTSVRWSPLKSPKAIWCVCSLHGSCACAVVDAASSAITAMNLNLLSDILWDLAKNSVPNQHHGD